MRLPHPIEVETPVLTWPIDPMDQSDVEEDGSIVRYSGSEAPQEAQASATTTQVAPVAHEEQDREGQEAAAQSLSPSQSTSNQQAETSSSPMGAEPQLEVVLDEVDDYDCDLTDKEKIECEEMYEEQVALLACVEEANNAKIGEEKQVESMETSDKDQDQEKAPLIDQRNERP